MPRWLSSTLIAIGFLALVAMALLPKNVEVTVDINANSETTFISPDHAAPAGAMPNSDNGTDDGGA